MIKRFDVMNLARKHIFFCLPYHITSLTIQKSFFFYSKITKRKTSQQYKNKCHVCNIPINLENSSDFVTCGSCNQSPICKNLHCAILCEKTKVWNCKLCRSFLNGSSSACDWLISQLNDKLLQGKSADGHNKIVWNQSSSNGEINS